VFIADASVDAEYGFLSCSGHSHWLQLDRCVLDHSFLKSAGPLVMHLAVR